MRLGRKLEFVFEYMYYVYSDRGRGWEEMSYTEDLDYEPTVAYPDELWDAVREEGWQGAEPAERQFAHGGTWDVEPAEPVLGLAVIRTAEGDVSGLSGDELLGAIAAIDRVAGQAAW